jgi:hypothetical protein
MREWVSERVHAHLQTSKQASKHSFIHSSSIMIISHPPTHPHLSKYHIDQSRSTPIDSNASSDHQSFNKFFLMILSPTYSLTHIFEVQRSGRSSKDWLEWLKGAAARSSRFFVDSLHSINPSLGVLQTFKTSRGGRGMMMM